MIFQKEAQAVGAKVLFDSTKLSEGYCFQKNDYLIIKAIDLLKQQGVEPKLHYAVGGSDANVLNQHGIHTVVISSATRNNHQYSEYLIIKDLFKLTDFFLRLALYSKKSNINSNVDK